MDLQAERMRRILSAMPVEDVLEFDRIFGELYWDAYHWDLWAAAYIIEGGCSDDGFMDFRSWLISMGREVYKAAMADAESLAEVAARPGVELTRFEGFGNIAWQVLD